MQPSHGAQGVVMRGARQRDNEAVHTLSTVMLRKQMHEPCCCRT